MSGEEIVANGEDEYIYINLRGQVFEVSQSTLNKGRKVKLYRLLCEAERNNGTKQKSFRFDRNPFVFHSILDYYNTGELHLPDGLCGRLIKKELEFWEIGQHLVMPCCLAKLESADEVLRHVDKIQKLWLANLAGVNDDTQQTSQKGRNTWKSRVWTVLSAPNSSCAAQVFYGLYLTVITASLLILAIQTEHSIRHPIDASSNLTFPSNMTLYDWLKRTYPPYWMAVADFVLLGLISAVLLARLVTCPVWRKFCRDPYNMAELVGTVPQWIPCTVLLARGAVVLKASESVEHLMFALAIWKAMRVVPFVRALRHYRGIRMMGMALGASIHELVFLAIVLFVGSLLFGYALYISEMWSPKTEVFGAPDAMWWGIITMTTVGYGDIVPSTWPGKMVGFVCAVTGILMVALPVPIIASNFYVINQNVKIADLKNELCSKQNEAEENRKRDGNKIHVAKSK